MTKVEYDERMEFTNIFWHIRNSFLMQIQLIDPFNRMKEDEWMRHKDNLIKRLVMQNQGMIARFGHLYRKYNMNEHYE